MSYPPYPASPSAPPADDQRDERTAYPGGNLPYPPPGAGNPYPTSDNTPYPAPGVTPYPAPGVTPYPASGGAPYPTPGGAPFPASGGVPYSVPGSAPYPPQQQQGGQHLPYPTQPAGLPYPCQDHYGGPVGQQWPSGSSYPPPGPAAPQHHLPYPPESSGKATVNLNEGPVGGLLSKSKLLGKVVDKGLQLANEVANKVPVANPGGQTPYPTSNVNVPGPGTTVTDGNCMTTPNDHFRRGKGAKKFANQDYEELKRKCQSRGVLFEDPEFPASHRLLVDDSSRYVVSYFGRSLFEESSIEWLRPHEICQRLRLPRPEMFVGDSDRFDINQGEIGNCWFLAALANLAESKKCFYRVVPQDQTFGGRDYAGIFRFRFWRFGEWTEVVIDDRLPTRRGQLIYLRSVEKNEFWGALLEKAYAKLHGSYRALEGGLTIEAAVDFTGGIPELIDLTRTKYSPERLFYIMSKADNRGAFMGCALSNSSRVNEAQRLGLQTRHAYTITKVVEIRSNRSKGGIPLIRLRNPHGNYKEWRGDWSDDDRNWQMIPGHMRSSLGLTFEDDGEFYMSFRDFLKYFGELEICHLSPDGVDLNDNRKQFEVFNFFGSWRAGSTAGGCGNDGNRYFCINPQHFINLSDPDPYDDETHCPVVISIAQQQKQRKSEHAIGFKIYQCNLTDRQLDERFFAHNQSVDRVDTFINLREVSKRILLPQGRYCIVPCTFSKGEEGDYLLRVFVEKRWGSSESSRGRAVGLNEDVDGAMGNMRIDPGPPPPAPPRSPSRGGFGFKKQNKVTGFALKMLEQNFPKEMKRLKDFYNWATDRDSEFDLLGRIVKGL